MKAQRHQLAMQLFHDALAKGRDERETFLRQACGADDRLRAEVESLLANHQSRTILIRRAGSTAAPSGNIAGAPRQPMDARSLGRALAAATCKLAWLHSRWRLRSWDLAIGWKLASSVLSRQISPRHWTLPPMLTSL